MVSYVKHKSEENEVSKLIFSSFESLSMLVFGKI